MEMEKFGYTSCAVSVSWTMIFFCSDIILVSLNIPIAMTMEKVWRFVVICENGGHHIDFQYFSRWKKRSDAIGLL